MSSNLMPGDNSGPGGPDQPDPPDCPECDGSGESTRGEPCELCDGTGVDPCPDRHFDDDVI